MRSSVFKHIAPDVQFSIETHSSHRELEDVKWDKKRQQRDANSELTEVLEFSDKDCKGAIIKCFSEQL